MARGCAGGNCDTSSIFRAITAIYLHDLDLRFPESRAPPGGPIQKFPFEPREIARGGPAAPSSWPALCRPSLSGLREPRNCSFCLSKKWGRGTLLHSPQRQMLRSAGATNSRNQRFHASSARAIRSDSCSRFKITALFMRASVRPFWQRGTDLFSSLISHASLPGKW